MHDVVSVILGGGQGSRLRPLTEVRSKPAVPIFGKYRIVDIPISNCLHAGIDQIYVLTQFNSASLNRHVSVTFRFDVFRRGFVEILAAEQTLQSARWYQGTADAVRQHVHRICGRQAQQVLVLSGDHVYRMNFKEFVRQHRARGADLTIAVKPVTREEAKGFGILQMDAGGRIVDFVEKPESDEDLERLRVQSPPWDDARKAYLASMGIYVFQQDVLDEVLSSNDETDFGRHIIPAAIRDHRVYAHFFDGYWEDIGTIRTFYDANLALTDPHPPFELAHNDTPIYTHMRHLAGARLDGCHLQRAIVCDGSRLRDAKVTRSIIGIRSVIGAGAQVHNTVMMGADYYEDAGEVAAARARGLPRLGIGPGCHIQNAIIDKNARIGEGVIISNRRGLKEAAEPSHYIRDGIVVIPKNAVIPAGTEI